MVGAANRTARCRGRSYHVENLATAQAKGGLGWQRQRPTGSVVTRVDRGPVRRLHNAAPLIHQLVIVLSAGWASVLVVGIQQIIDMNLIAYMYLSAKECTSNPLTGSYE